MIVVDTNVVSELMRPAPSPVVSDWIRAHGESELYTTSITLAEIRYGIKRLPEGRRKELLTTTAEEVFAAFAEQVLPFGVSASAQYATIACDRDHVGLPLDGFDAQIAAICRAHQATLATRNLEDFKHAGIDVVDPWDQT